MSNGKEKSAVDVDSKRNRYFFQEFLVDILGGLVPGLLFLTGATFALLPPLSELHFSYLDQPRVITLSDVQRFFESVRNTPNTIWFFSFLGLIVITYVFGHLFYRRDPKHPNKKSFERLEKYEIYDFIICQVWYQINQERYQNTREGPRGVAAWSKFEKIVVDVDTEYNLFVKSIAVLIQKFPHLRHIFRPGLLNRLAGINTRDKVRKHIIGYMEENYGAATPDQCEFPYPTLHKYLKKRGLEHLIKFVLWQEEEHIDYRSKVYANILKIRIGQEFPEKTKTIVRNEAHVRLASSTWYVSRTLIFLSSIGLVILLASMLLNQTHNNVASFLTLLIKDHFASFMSPLLTLSISAYSINKINTFLHYQRMREIVFVLETAYFAFKNIGDSLDPPFKDVYQMQETG